jgi:hypothetical protein
MNGAPQASQKYQIFRTLGYLAGLRITFLLLLCIHLKVSLQIELNEDRFGSLQGKTEIFLKMEFGSRSRDRTLRSFP